MSSSIYEGCECLGAIGVWRAVVSYRKRPDRAGLAFGVDHCISSMSLDAPCEPGDVRETTDRKFLAIDLPR